MNWNELPADELLERIKSKSDSDREDILNDYIVENHDKLQPLKLLPLLDAIDQIKKSNLEKGNLTEEGTENCLNDRVFLSLWMAKIYLNELFDVNRSRELVDEAKDLIQRYEGKYVKEMRDTNEQTLMELSEKLKQISKEVASDKEGQMPKPFEDYLNLLEKKRVFKEQVNENVGHTRRYGYLFTGNSGTGKRSAAKQLFNVLKAIESETQIWVEIPAIQMFDPSSGFSPIGNTIEENRHRNSGSVQLLIKGIRIHDDASDRQSDS